VFRSLLFNTGVSTLAFAMVSIVGLLLVPVLIGAYGLEGFGLIALARLFVPTAALALLDFGFGEITTQSVAAARTDGDWNRCRRQVGLAVAGALSVGVLAGVALAAVAVSLPAWLSIEPATRADFSVLMWINAALLPVLFLSLVLEGAIKGLENFLMQRAIEVTAALVYAALVLGCVYAGRGPLWVAAALLASLTLRAVVALVAAAHGLSHTGARRLDRWADADLRWFLPRCRAFAANKVLGVGQNQLGALLIGLLAGPAAVGRFDALVRLPRFAKSVLGLLTSALLPVAARLESAADVAGLRRLGESGILFVGVVTLPPLATAMALSEPILRTWIGESLAQAWQWQALMFMVPAFTVLVSFGSTALMVRPHAVSAMNRLIAIQVLIQFGISLPLVQVLEERAFMLGQVIAVALTFVPQMRLVRTELRLTNNLAPSLTRLLIGLVVVHAPFVLAARWIQGWAALSVAFVVALLCGWAMCAVVVLTPSQRARLHQIATEWLARIRD
jgi:O-antigen/teichoic acid export membrane protein